MKASQFQEKQHIKCMEKWRYVQGTGKINSLGESTDCVGGKLWELTLGKQSEVS